MERVCVKEIPGLSITFKAGFPEEKEKAEKIVKLFGFTVTDFTIEDHGAQLIGLHNFDLFKYLGKRSFIEVSKDEYLNVLMTK